MTREKLHQLVQLVGKKMKKAVPEKLREWLEEEGHTETAITEEEREKGEGIKYLVGEVKKAYQLAKILNGAPLPLIREKIKETQSPPDNRFEALSEIIAFLAGRDEAVQVFRREVLGGKLLSTEEAHKWIKEQAKEMHTLSISLNITAGGDWEEKVLEEAKRLVKAKKAGEIQPYKVKYAFLEYILPPSRRVYEVLINETGVLGHLKHIANNLTGHWSEAEAVCFILTGEMPLISPAIIRITFGITGTTIPKITIEASPYLRSDEVESIYAQAKNQIQQEIGRSRRLSEKHLTLAVFALKEGGSWQEVLSKWNKEYPQWQYKEKRAFARDAKTAYKRVTGLELERTDSRGRLT